MTEVVTVTPAIEVQVVFDREGGRAFQARVAPLPLDVTKEQLDKTLDMLLGAVERQRVYYELMDELALLETQVGRINKYEKNILGVLETSKAWWEAEGRKGEWSSERLSPNEKNERERLTMALTNDRNDMQARREKIQKLKARIANGHAPDSAADSVAGMH